jgi:hypothetical protein
MIGIFAEHAATFLRVTAVMTAVVFSIPLLLAPLAWARVFRWKVDARADLALYFGRCLGAFATLVSWGAWHAAGQPGVQRMYFEFIVAFALLMVAIHIVGALQKVQPWTETAEIPFWGALACVALICFPPA